MCICICICTCMCTRICIRISMPACAYAFVAVHVPASPCQRRLPNPDLPCRAPTSIGICHHARGEFMASSDLAPEGSKCTQFENAPPFLKVHTLCMRMLWTLKDRLTSAACGDTRALDVCVISVVMGLQFASQWHMETSSYAKMACL